MADLEESKGGVFAGTDVGHHVGAALAAAYAWHAEPGIIQDVPLPRGPADDCRVQTSISAEWQPHLFQVIVQCVSQPCGYAPS